MAENQEKKKPTSTGKKVTTIILAVLLVVVLVAGVFAIVHVKTSKDPTIFGYGIFTVASGSMTPALKVGDVIFVKKVSSADELEKGDVITFHGRGEKEGKIVTHRIVSEGVEEDGYITTCGDANNGATDTPITLDDVIGKVIRKSVVFSSLHTLFASKVGFALLVVIPLVIMLIYQFVNFVRACKMDKDGNVKGEEPEETQEEKDRKLVEEYLKRQKRIKDAEKKNKK